MSVVNSNKGGARTTTDDPGQSTSVGMVTPVNVSMTPINIAKTPTISIAAKTPTRVPSFHTVQRTTPRKYGELPGKMRIIRRSILMDKGEEESIMPNPYEIARGHQWQGFAGSYRTQKNYDNDNEKPFFITYDMGPLSNQKKKPMLQTIQIQRNFTADIDTKSSAKKQRERLPPLDTQSKQYDYQRQQYMFEGTKSNMTDSSRRSKSQIRQFKEPPEIERNFSFAKEIHNTNKQMIGNVRIGIGLSPVKIHSTRRNSNYVPKDLYYTQSIFNQEQSNYLAFEPKIARTINRIEKLNKQAGLYSSGSGAMFDKSQQSTTIGEHLVPQEAATLPSAKDPVQARMLLYQSRLNQLRGEQAQRMRTDQMQSWVKNDFRGVQQAARGSSTQRPSYLEALANTKNNFDPQQTTTDFYQTVRNKHILLKNSKNAQKLSSFFKGAVARMRFKKFRARKIAACTKIQAFFKMKWARRAYLTRLSNLYWNSAILVQKALRGFAVYKEYRETIHRVKADKLYNYWLKIRKDELINAKIKIWWAWKLKRRRKIIKAAKKKKKAKKGKKKKKKKPDPAQGMVKAGEGGIIDISTMQGDAPPDMGDDDDEEDEPGNNADIENLDGEDGEPKPEGEDGEPKPEGEDGEPKPEGEDGEPKPEGEDGEPKPEGEDGEPKPEGEEGEPKPEGEGEEGGEPKPEGEGEEGGEEKEDEGGED